MDQKRYTVGWVGRGCAGGWEGGTGRYVWPQLTQRTTAPTRYVWVTNVPKTYLKAIEITLKTISN